ncbi:MAG: hypothetical protein SO188_13155 [Prevotella sp.]|nr:hypothetical protein [Prevotella sp.]
MPKLVDGRFHINSVVRITTAALIAVLFKYSGSLACSRFTCSLWWLSNRWKP